MNLRVSEGLSFREVGDVLNISEDEVLEKMKSLVPINRLVKVEGTPYFDNFDVDEFDFIIRY